MVQKPTSTFARQARSGITWLNRPPRRSRLKLAAAGVVLVALVWMLLPSRESLPDFRKYEAGPERKQAFFAYLIPFVDQANDRILERRHRIQKLEDRWTRKRHLGRSDSRWLLAQAEANGMDDESEDTIDRGFFTELLTHVDIIPPSLALSQAALESAWGTSRFARDGNNLFGTWCYDPGCGLVPRRRSAGATHEVKVYDSPRDSFVDYIENLNRHPAYREMRRIRRVARAGDRPILGTELARGLHRYSQQGSAYVAKIDRMIRSNDLVDYDRGATG